MKNIKVIAFDADDTLWANETFFQETEKKFCTMMTAYGTSDHISKELFRTEMQNMEIYGYGIKAFILSIIETALRVSGEQISSNMIKRIIDLGKGMLHHPIEILRGVTETLEALAQTDYQIIVATKGDLLDQKRKLRDSQLSHYFHHVEIMSDKQEGDYIELFSRLQVEAEEFLMIGNSYKSDCLPILNLGGYAVHVPFHTTWEHEANVRPNAHLRFFEAHTALDVLAVLKT